MRGPIDYIIVGFEGNNFTGEILQELDKASANGTIAVLALGIITRDADGTVAAVEMSAVDDPEIAKLIGSMQKEPGLITSEDVEEVGELLEDNSSAGLLIVEQLWAKGLKQAVINANGTLLAEGRIHSEASDELDKEDN